MTMEEEKDFKCSQCEAELGISEIGFLGESQHLASAINSQPCAEWNCTPFTSMVCLCQECYDKKIMNSKKKEQS